MRGQRQQRGRLLLAFGLLDVCRYNALQPAAASGTPPVRLTAAAAARLLPVLLQNARAAEPGWTPPQPCRTCLRTSSSSS